MKTLITIFSIVIMCLLQPLSFAANEVIDQETGCKVWNSKPLDGYSVLWSGSCKNGKADGKGSLQWFHQTKPEGRYDGDYALGKMHGHGTYAMEDGSRYIGDFQNNLREGRGAYLWADGTRYEGDYKNNQMQGKGTTYWIDGSFYVGEFQRDKKHGFGKLSLVLDNPYIDDFKSEGKWVGNYFIVEGIFADDELVYACPSEQSCIKVLTHAMQH